MAAAPQWPASALPHAFNPLPQRFAAQSRNFVNARIHRGVRMLVTVVALWCLPASAASPAAESAPLDFSRYQQLLDEYLVVVSAPGAPLETRFDYFKLYDNPGKAERLLSVRAALLGVSPAELQPAPRRAWAINTYNFLVVELATTNLISRHVGVDLKARGVLGISHRSVRHMRIKDLGFFEVPVARIDGRDYNLDQFERAFVFDTPDPPAAGSKPNAPAKTLDPRAHFALVCGALGCPPLQPRAFTADSLDAQLDRATLGALTSPNHLSWDPILKRLAASAVFSWYEADFGGPAKAFEFAARHAPEALRAEIAAKPQPGIDRVLPWNWDLNMVPRKPPVPRPAPKAP